MATTPVLNQFGGGMGTGNIAPGAPIAGMGNSTSNFIPMPPQGGSQNNPTGSQGGSTTGAGAPVQPQLNLPNVTALPGATVGTPGGVGASGTSLTTGTSMTPTNSELNSIYGQGVGGIASGILSNNGMNIPLTEEVNAATINGMQQNINSGSANLAATLGAQGVSGNSSTNALAQSNYEGQATAQENATISGNFMNEYNQGQQLLESILAPVLGTAAQNQADQFNWEDLASLGIAGANLGLEGAEVAKL